MDEIDTGPLDQAEDVQALYSNGLALLRLAQSATSEQIKTLTDGETVPLAELLRASKELAASIEHAFKLEQKLDEWTGHRAGDQGGSFGNIDFDAARDDIGCRLDRLRACCRSE